MQQGAWTIKACASDDVRALAEALEICELTASVLVRRGYSEEQIRKLWGENTLRIWGENQKRAKTKA